jgi:hypothetical protein
MPAAMRSDTEVQKMKDQIAKESDPRKRAELQKQLSQIKNPSEPKRSPQMGGGCCGTSAAKGKKH